MVRFHGVNNDGETMSSFYVDHDPETFGCDPGGPSLTRQEFADECDINTLMATYEKTGVLNHYNSNTPQYLDVSGVPDLAQAIQIVADAQTAFMTLNAETRKQFDNDPVKFVNFAENPENLDKLREWKLAPPKPELEAPKVEVST
ncbi:MAG: internal scaffolding protein [Microvirus sp.]|nr:MAG: internal scaffolding protein [Microvirus sp.]